MFVRKLLSKLRRTTANTMNTAGVISHDDLKKLLATKNYQLFDVRTPEEVKNGKIPNSTNIPVSEIEVALKMDPDTFKATYHVEKPRMDDDNNLVFHCQLGRRGQRATEIAAELGYKHARNYLGGYNEWAEKEGK